MFEERVHVSIFRGVRRRSAAYICLCVAAAYGTLRYFCVCVSVSVRIFFFSNFLIFFLTPHKPFHSATRKIEYPRNKNTHTEKF